MATIAESRMFALAWQGGSGPPNFQLSLVTGTQSQGQGVGSVLVEDAASGTLTVDNSDPATVVGILEKTTPAAVTTGDRFPVTLLLPNFFYEISVDTGTVARSDMYDVAPFINNLGGDTATGAANFAELDSDSTGANDIINMFAFASDFDRFITGMFIDQAATAATAGATNSPLGGAKGVAGDTTPRIIITMTSAGCTLVG